jgi:hypothetical protein
MSKQTAVEWLVSEYAKAFKIPVNAVMGETIEQAKAMEREQITEAHLQGLYSDIKMRGEAQAEQYYNETYKKDKNDTSI